MGQELGQRKAWSSDVLDSAGVPGGGAVGGVLVVQPKLGARDAEGGEQVEGHELVPAMEYHTARRVV